MYDRKTQLTLPISFNFPFEPYEIQRDFMQQLFKIIENKEIGIFESPTGTGKTLTLTCGALTWLIEHETALNEELQTQITTLKDQIEKLTKENAKCSDWISGRFETFQLKQKLSEIKSELDALHFYKNRIKEIRNTRNIEKEIKKFIKMKENEDSHTEIGEEDDPYDQFMIDDSSNSSINDFEENSDENERYHDTKIFFCSRTHSQLSQVVQEIKRTVFGTETRVAALASRLNYCVNPDVRSLKSNSLINERCLELQKGTKGIIRETDTHGKATKKAKTSKKCPFYSQTGVEKLKNEILSEIMDIEDLVRVAKTHKTCPYYASRLAANDSQVIMVPYQIILHKKTREQTGIDIRDSVLIIDEAHNLLDTISTIHSTQISLKELQVVREQLETYKRRYLSRFSAKSVLKINQLIYIAKRLIFLFKNAETSKMISVCELITDAELFDVNISELSRFAKDSRLAEKLHGFAVNESKKRERDDVLPKIGVKSYLKQLEDQNKPKNKKETQENVKESSPLTSNSEKVVVVNAIRPFLSLLDCLLEEFEDGRILISTGKESFLKYLVLNPGAHFKDLVRQCRAVRFFA